MRRISVLISLLGLTVACGESFEQPPTSGSGGTGGSAGMTSADGGSGGEVIGPGGRGGAGGREPMCFDDDEDGFTTCQDDCDDNNPLVYPGADEICGDGVDNACGNTPDPEGLCQGLGTFVSTLTGHDSNPGTTDMPLATITAGIANAVMISTDQPVFVAEGMYNEDVDLSEGVDLLGGHQCSNMGCNWQRDTELYVSHIENQDLNGIYATPAITRETLVDGFTVQAVGGNPGDSQTSSAFQLEGAPTIRNNIVLGGDIVDCSQCSSVAIVSSAMADSAESALIESNIIVAGDAGGNNLSIAVGASEGGSVDVFGNDITGGQATTTRSIFINSTANYSQIIGNEIYAGDCSGINTTYAIFVNQGVDPLIDSNLINIDPNRVVACPQFGGPLWTGGIESAGSAAVITNNIIAGIVSDRSTAVYLGDCQGDGCPTGEVALVNNTLLGLGTNNNATISAALVLSTVMPNRTIFPARVRNNILVGGDAQLNYATYEYVPTTSSTAEPLEYDNNFLAAQILYRHWDGPNLEQLFQTIGDVNDMVNGVNGADLNLDGDPMLDEALHLLPGSPCIDNGTQIDTATPMFDIDGDLRPNGNQVDIGADEAG